MKKLTTIAILLLAICLVACSAPADTDAVWKNASHKTDTELGSGANTCIAEVVVGENKVVFTVHTDKTTVGAALLEHGLIEGANGLYTVVNGMTADYNVDQSYWAFYIGGEMAMQGADDTEIAEGTVYRFEYTK